MKEILDFWLTTSISEAVPHLTFILILTNLVMNISLVSLAFSRKRLISIYIVETCEDILTRVLQEVLIYGRVCDFIS